MHIFHRIRKDTFLVILLLIMIFLYISFNMIIPGEEFCIDEKNIKLILKKAIEHNSSKEFSKLEMNYKYCPKYQDRNKLLEIYRITSKLGLPDMQYSFGRSEIYNARDKKLREEGIYWLRKAAQNGYQDAIVELRKNNIDILYIK